MPFIDDKLGRYEYVHAGSHADKFWTVYRHPGRPDVYVVTWGKNGRKPQGTQEIDATEALKRINAKLKGGYDRIEDAKGNKIKPSRSPLSPAVPDYTPSKLTLPKQSEKPTPAPKGFSFKRFIEKIDEK